MGASRGGGGRGSGLGPARRQSTGGEWRRRRRKEKQSAPRGPRRVNSAKQNNQEATIVQKETRQRRETKTRYNSVIDTSEVEEARKDTCMKMAMIFFLRNKKDLSAVHVLDGRLAEGEVDVVAVGERGNEIGS